MKNQATPKLQPSSCLKPEKMVKTEKSKPKIV